MVLSNSLREAILWARVSLMRARRSVSRRRSPCSLAFSSSSCRICRLSSSRLAHSSSMPAEGAGAAQGLPGTAPTPNPPPPPPPPQRSPPTHPPARLTLDQLVVVALQRRALLGHRRRRCCSLRPAAFPPGGSSSSSNGRPPARPRDGALGRLARPQHRPGAGRRSGAGSGGPGDPGGGGGRAARGGGGAGSPRAAVGAGGVAAGGAAAGPAGPAGARVLEPGRRGAALSAALAGGLRAPPPPPGALPARPGPAGGVGEAGGALLPGRPARESRGPAARRPLLRAPRRLPRGRPPLLRAQLPHLHAAARRGRGGGRRRRLGLRLRGGALLLPAGHGAVPAAQRHPVGTGGPGEGAAGLIRGSAGLLSGVFCLPSSSHELNLLERVSADAVTHVLHGMIEERVEWRCRGEYERSFLGDFQEWIDKVIGWLSRVFLQESAGGLPGPAASSTLKRWRCHVQMFFYRLYASMRIEELFSIIRDFPESKPAVEDLKYCLERTNQRQQLLTSLKSALELRLLHPGVNTSDIITLYISAIKALRELDSSMVILEVACEPIRKYLRTREDTVRQIVAGLTGDAEGSADLANELSKADPVTLENGQESEDDVSEPEDWVPDPVDADPGKSSSKRRSSDIISLLVSIYGSKDLFINEYRTLLADRLLHQFNYSAEREIRNVELLKLRFGEAQMHYCEVMLKDMADSRRINANIRDEEQKLPEQERPPFSLVAIILSSEFWPPLKEEKLELPGQIKEAMEAYAKKYEKLKAMRTLNWKHHLGLVNLEVELADRTLSLSVSPVHAAVILHFQGKSTWTLEELSEALKVPAASLRRKMTLWLQQGVLREEPPGTFTVIEEELKDQAEKVVLIDSDEEGDSAMASQADQKEEELQLFWTYIQAMLTNLESLSLERIHSMLKIFVMTGPMVTEIDIQELQVFLQKKVRDQQLSYSGGVYRLPKSCN
uniref:Anaphase-promoting complex subunit 2 n=1 Tax=Pseudonaja textilis TaxID=8673 RepID=A0A670YH84_PSETE